MLLVATTGNSARPDSDLPTEYRLAWIENGKRTPIRMSGDEAGVRDAAVGPDGKTIAAVLGTNRVITLDPATGATDDVLPALPPLDVIQPSAYLSLNWISASQLLVREAFPGGLSIIDLQAKALRLLPDSGLDPAPSPNGQRLAIGRAGSEPFYSTYLTDLQFKDARKLTDDHIMEASAAWSPDGAWIAYSANAGLADSPATSAWEIRVIRPDGGSKRTLLPRGAGITYPTLRWSPDSRSLAFTSYDLSSRKRSVGIVDLAGPVIAPASGQRENNVVLGWVR